MDFDFSPEEEAFRAKVQEFLDEALPADYDPREHGYGRNPEFQKQWNQALGKAGYLGYAWPKGRTAMARWRIGSRHEACLIRIAELRELIAETEAQTLAGAAVQLRRLDAMLDGEDQVAVGLLESALQVVDREVLSAGT